MHRFLEVKGGSCCLANAHGSYMQQSVLPRSALRVSACAVDSVHSRRGVAKVCGLVQVSGWKARAGWPMLVCFPV